MTDRSADQPFSLSAADDGAWALSGEVDTESEGALRGLLAETCAEGWVVDVGGLDFSDVAGMRAIATAAGSAGRPLVLRGASVAFRRYWTLAGFADLAHGVRFTD